MDKPIFNIPFVLIQITRFDTCICTPVRVIRCMCVYVQNNPTQSALNDAEGKLPGGVLCEDYEEFPVLTSNNAVGFLLFFLKTKRTSVTGYIIGNNDDVTSFWCEHAYSPCSNGNLKGENVRKVLARSSQRGWPRTHAQALPLPFEFNYNAKRST